MDYRLLALPVCLVERGWSNSKTRKAMEVGVDAPRQIRKHLSSPTDAPSPLGNVHIEYTKDVWADNE